MMKRLGILFCFIVCSLPCHVKIAQADSVKSTFTPPLTGQEVLLELSDPRGELPSGIYAWNPVTPPTTSNLRLWVKGGHHPVWSPHYQRIAYIFNGDIWIVDKEGQGAAIGTAFVSEHVFAESQVIQWSPDGNLYFTRTSPVAGTAVFATIPLEEINVHDLHEGYRIPFNGFWSLQPFKNKMQDYESQTTGDISNVDWQNIQASNNAAFSPDGSSVAVETYPAGPMNLSRLNSHIRIYDALPKTKTVQEYDKNLTELVLPWFYRATNDARVAGPGRLLLQHPESTDTEIMPLWSPDGKHIALTLVNSVDPSMVPVIVDPKGNQVLKVNSPQFGILPDSTWKTADMNQQSSGSVEPNSSKNKIFRQAISWSDDGDYLWMREGTNGLSVTKKSTKKWLIRPVRPDDISIFAEPLKSCFREDKALWINDTGDLRKILNIYIFDAETGKTQTYSLRSALKVLSVDW